MRKCILTLMFLITALPATAQSDPADSIPASDQQQAQGQKPVQGGSDIDQGAGLGMRGRMKRMPGQSGQGGQGGQGGQSSITAEQREQRRAKMIARFDLNHDGQLDADEKAQMKQLMMEKRRARQSKGGKWQGQGAGSLGFGADRGTPSQQGIPPQGQQ